MPSCRNAAGPGFISIVTHDLMTHFETLITSNARGALPVHLSNALKYSLTWSTDGLINEYGNLCYGIEDGRKIPCSRSKAMRRSSWTGCYTKPSIPRGLRHAGRQFSRPCENDELQNPALSGSLRENPLLMKDLRLNEDRKTLKRVLEHAIPQTLQDVVLIYASVTGTKEGEFFEESYVKKSIPNASRASSGRPFR